MAHGILLVLSEPVSAADDAAYNDWYDHVHLPEVLALPGFVSARRYRMSEVQLPSQGGLESVSRRFPSRYVATYEVAGPDPAVATKALTEASSGLTVSPAMAYDRTIAVLFEEIRSL
jgi:hypothetical protein